MGVVSRNRRNFHHGREASLVRIDAKQLFSGSDAAKRGPGINGTGKSVKACACP